MAAPKFRLQARLPDFVPAKPARWFIAAAQTAVRAELALSNRLYLAEEELRLFSNIPKGAGVILTSNHADETDPLVCLELSRRSGRRFISMCNREAFDEMGGLAGLALQRLGHFSVKRGAHDTAAKEYAIKTVQQGENVLVIFPEGEIFYLNEVVQPFHSGAIEICIQAILENRKATPDWTAYILPMVIKYHYNTNIERELANRISKMESHLLLRRTSERLQERLAIVQGMLIDREKRSHSIIMEQASALNLGEQLTEVQRDILAQVESKHQELPVSNHGKLIDHTWQLEAELRERMQEQADTALRAELKQDLESLKEVAQLTAWRPSYWQTSESTDRLAEAVLKTEREFFKVKRPKQLSSRYVFVKLSEPMNMGEHADEYAQDALGTRHRLTASLHDRIQGLIDALTGTLAKS
jgi:1-acyl-sn-glycerol-3-phosphate acyltransferase